MTSTKFSQISSLCNKFAELPDGAFLGVMAEHGFDADDLLEYTIEVDKRKERQVNRGSRRNVHGGSGR